MRNARREKHDNSWDDTTVGANIFSDEQAKEGFSAAVVDLSASRLAKVGGITDDGARKLKEGRSAPRLSTAVRVARRVVKVRTWLLAEIGHECRDMGTASPDAIAKALMAMAAGNDEAALHARAVLRQILTAPVPADVHYLVEKKPPAGDIGREHQDDLFERKRAS